MVLSGFGGDPSIGEFVLGDERFIAVGILPNQPPIALERAILFAELEVAIRRLE
jgi:hypothetical protein